VYLDWSVSDEEAGKFWKGAIKNWREKLAALDHGKLTKQKKLKPFTCLQVARRLFSNRMKRLPKVRYWTCEK
jgi:hypothetical protein